MNEPERSALESLKLRQARLEQELALLAKELKAMESRLEASSARPPVSEPAALPAQEIQSPPLKPAPALPPPLPPIIPQQRPAPAARAAEFAARMAPGPEAPAPQVSAAPAAAAAPRPAPAPADARSLEMRLGTYWLVRVGIVVLLTGLVFFGNYAYQKFIIKLNALGKVSLLYLAGAALLGAGAWWQRQGVKETLKNYAQVLFAGGLALVYFTTYAAHHLDTLHVIDSALVDGLLLLGWAGFMIWIADRKKSEVLALFAVGLAYYTSVMTRVGSFTLYSNLLLTIAAVFFLVRNRWAALSYASLVASYAAYGYWRFFDGTQWHWASPEEGLWNGTYFLMSYWLVFTAAVFLSKHTGLAGENRASFLTLNNVEFFVMFLLTMLQVREGKFWKFSLTYGSALLVCAELARRLLKSEPLTKNTYLTQGLVLVTVGFIAKFTGLKLALLLSAESVVLLTLGCARKNLVLQTGAFISGALAVYFGIDRLERNDWPGLWIGTAVGVAMIFNAFWCHRQIPANKNPVRPGPAFFTVLALIIWMVTTWYNTSAARFPVALAVETLALTFSIYLLRVPEITLFGQAFLAIAYAAWLYRFCEPGVRPPWWNPAVMIAVSVGLSHWWQRQKVLAIASEVRWFWQGLCSLAFAGILYFWQQPLWEGPAWLVLTSALAVGITAYGVFTRAWAIAICGQLFLSVSLWQFAIQLSEKKPEWYFPLAPLAAMILLSSGTVLWFQRNPGAGEKAREPLLQLALVYRWAALLLSLWWIHEYIPARERIWFAMLCGLLAFLWGGWRRNTEALCVSAVYGLFGLSLFWNPLRESREIYWPDLFAILVLLGQQRVAKRLPGRYPIESRIHGAVILLGGLSLWLFVSRWVLQMPGKSYLTASWSGLALVLFLVGIVTRERVYRWIGLGLLACTLVRVGFVDIWKLKELYRILSLIALAVVLLLLGFIYSKYQEKIKEWL